MDTTTPNFDTPKAVVLAGLCGSLLSLSFVDDMGVRQRIAAVLSGIVMSHYVAPFIAKVFNEDNFVETIGFLVGLFGMSICAAVFRAIKISDLWGLVFKRFGRRADDVGGEP